MPYVESPTVQRTGPAFVSGPAFVTDPRPGAGPQPAGPPVAGPSGVQVVREHDEDLRGTTARHRFGEVLVSLAEGGPFEAIRPGRLIDREAEGYLRLSRMLAGELWVFQDGRFGAARGPQLICSDTSRTFKLVLPKPFRMVSLLVPHRLMGVTPRETTPLTAGPWGGGQGLAALLSALLAELEEHGEEIDTAVDLLGSSVAGLTAALFTERMRTRAADSQVARQSLMLSVQSYVREHLADPDLCPATIAQRYNVSLRYLQKIFREHGTSPARWIRDERLARCCTELSDPGLAHLPVAVIGERSGLYGASHFSRLFRDRYGTTPRDYRRAVAAAALDLAPAAR